MAADPDYTKRKGRPIIGECNSLIEILPNSMIQFVHFSVKEFVFPVLFHFVMAGKLTIPK